MKTTKRAPRKAAMGIGKELRRLRKSKQLSVRGLAAELGFSPSFISQVENGQASPSIASSERIATALGVHLRDLFPERKTRAPGPVRPADRPVILSQWSKGRIEALTQPSDRVPVDAIMVDLQPAGSSGGKLHSAPTHRFAFVWQGTVVLNIGETEHRLKAGDAITLPAGTLHRWTNRSRRRVRFVIVSFRTP
jgi:transcriptional regulator with XRE-family HTH domain